MIYIYMTDESEKIKDHLLRGLIGQISKQYNCEHFSYNFEHEHEASAHYYPTHTRLKWCS